MFRLPPVSTWPDTLFPSTTVVRLDLVGLFGVAEDRQAKRRLGDEHGARHGFEACAGGIGAALVIARDDDPLAAPVEHDLRRAEDMARGHERDRKSTRLNSSH